MAEAPLSQIQTLFNSFDFDQNGVVDLAEFTQMMREINLRQSLMELFQMPLGQLKQLTANSKLTDEELEHMLASLNDNFESVFEQMSFYVYDAISNIVLAVAGNIDDTYFNDDAQPTNDVTAFIQANVAKLNGLMGENASTETLLAALKEAYMGALAQFAKPVTEFEAAFESMTGADNYVTRQELTAFLSDLPPIEPPLSAQDITDIVDAADVNNNEEISYEAFAKAYYETVMVKRFDMMMSDVMNGVAAVKSMGGPKPAPPVPAVQELGGVGDDGNYINGGGDEEWNMFGVKKVNGFDGKNDIDLHLIGFAAFLVVLLIALIVGILLLVVQTVNHKRRTVNRTYVNKIIGSSEDDELAEFM